MPSKNVLFGLIVGIIGVCVLVGVEVSTSEKSTQLPVIAAMMAVFSYAIATNYAKNTATLSSFDNAHGSMWASVIIVFPLLPFFPIREELSLDISMSVIVLGVVCTAIAYLLYFQLVSDLGQLQH